VWKQISYTFLFFLAGLQSIPKSLLEAAAIDGAGPVKALRHHRVSAAVADHLLPARRQHRLCGSSRRSASSTRRRPAGPGSQPKYSSTSCNKDAFKSLDLGGSAAQSVVMMAIIITLTVVQFRFVEKKVQY